MKRIALSFAMILAMAGTLHAQTYQIDTAASKVEWTGKKVTGQHNGVLQVKSGKVDVAGQKITGGEFSLDMTTIKVLDLQDPTSNQKLTNHLRSDDFFSVQTHPESKFKITSVKDKGNSQIEVTGDMTIKGITHPLTFPATVTFGPAQVTAKGKATIDRTKYDVRYGSGKFFQGLGDKLIYDDFEIQLELTAKPVS